MEKFKFRAHHPTSGMAFFTFEDIQSFHPDHTDDFTRGCVLFPDGDWRPLSNCTVMIWTGLYDVMEREIYEGDRVKWPHYKHFKEGTITWGISGFWIPPYLDKMNGFAKLEIIGNEFDEDSRD